MTRTLALVVGIAIAATAVIWRIAGETQAPQGVLLITLDTTRADRLSPYGFMNARMPALERLAREGVVFDRASTVAPLTLPAHASLFTSLLPPAHGVRDNAGAALDEKHTTLAEVLKARGFRTAAFVGSIVLDADRGLSQGFEHYSGVTPRKEFREHEASRPANEVIDDADRWMETIGDSRFFVWVHLYDPHRPYDPPEPFRSKYADPYIGEIAFADSQIGRLLDRLAARNLLNRTAVVVAGDHGEALGDHGERDHGIFIYESVIRVPLLIRSPRIAPGRTSEVVRLIDVAPTILDLLNIESAPSNGVSLKDVLTGRRHDLGLEVYAESLYPQRFGWSPLRSLREGRYKLIDAPRPELFDLDSDAFEQRNLVSERPNIVRAIAQRLNAIETVGPAQLDPVSPELRHRLAALGYIGSMSGTIANSTRLPDPKDCIAFSQLSAAVPASGRLPNFGAQRQSWTTDCGRSDRGERRESNRPEPLRARK